jgi:hypothetical protein
MERADRMVILGGRNRVVVTVRARFGEGGERAGELTIDQPQEKGSCSGQLS